MLHPAAGGARRHIGLLVDLLAKLSLALLGHVHLLDAGRALLAAGRWQLAQGRRELARQLWTALAELEEAPGAAGLDGWRPAPASLRSLGARWLEPAHKLVAFDASHLGADHHNNKWAAQRRHQMDEIRGWLLESLVGEGRQTEHHTSGQRAALASLAELAEPEAGPVCLVCGLAPARGAGRAPLATARPRLWLRQAELGALCELAGFRWEPGEPLAALQSWAATSGARSRPSEARPRELLQFIMDLGRVGGVARGQRADRVGHLKEERSQRRHSAGSSE